MRSLHVNGIDLHWREDGDPEGRPVVFANSLGTDLRLWDDLLPLLPKGLRLIRFDLRGHGLSGCPEAPYEMDTLVADAEALIDALGLENPVFVGLSIGGMIGQGLAAKRPELLRALVLSNTAAKMGEAAMWRTRMQAIREDGLASIGDAVMQRWFAPAFLQTDALPAWRNMMCRTPQEGYLGCCAAIAGTDLATSTAKLTLPVLGIAGADDGASPPELVKGTVDLIDGARFEVIDGTGHLPCAEKPEAYAEILTRFLKEIGHV
ncbi:3-oxoadipate enol-lactonase [Salipiger bermudensis]|uniref:3-oxoadipate enol-lactonase n=1 Tax=Salipiger bermudensis TaxID=344736 RepID=UPI001A8FFCD4|nr:3-oxoadipate enol-lactonase [Salipiger bermudensis]MBN9675987.1 3-oxoadipate enol-lactonase [Salipiger bermudensis]